MRILVFCPLSPTPPMLYGRTVQSIFRLEYGGPLHYLFHKGDNPYTVEGRWGRYANVTRNYNMARDVALRDGYDALLTVEADMVVPADALTKLEATGADVAYGLYIWRHGKREWSAYTDLHDRAGESLSRDPDAARAAWGQVVDVAGVGLGCTLIRRPVLEAMRFHFPDDALVCCDWMLALDCQARGFTQRAHLGVVCGHITTEPTPRVYWPDPEQGTLYRTEFLPPGVGV